MVLNRVSVQNLFRKENYNIMISNNQNIITIESLIDKVKCSSVKREKSQFLQLELRFNTQFDVHSHVYSLFILLHQHISKNP